MSDSKPAKKASFCVLLVKPSHYDDDGYVIQWLRSPVPSNSLAVMYGLAHDCSQRKVLGDTPIDVIPFDETNTRISTDHLASLIAQHGSGVVMLVGVQSNQFPRALDIARPLRKLGIPVVIGGFHVSGTLAMLKEREPNVRLAEEMGISIFAGEAEEGRLDQLILDAAGGELLPLYDYRDNLPDLGGAVTPLLPADRIKRVLGNHTSFDAGRGCPFSCSFCTIINVQGRKSRSRTPDDIERIVRTNLDQGIHSFFITDDNFARNQSWEQIFDRLIHLREVEKLNVKCTIQVDTGCHRIPNFIDKAKRAGVRRVFIGLENINPENLKGARKNQNKITEYRKMLLLWKQSGATIFCGYITGFPNDTRESILNEVRIIQRELPTDLLEFTCMTPLPGSEDHKKMYEAGQPMDEDLNRYDVNHVTVPHPRMTREEWEETYEQAWADYYTNSHMETVFRRCIATGSSPGKTLFYLVWFRGSTGIEKVHPAEGGFFRLKYRKDRRPTLPLESPLKFYPKYVIETIAKQSRWVALWTTYYWILWRVKRDPKKLEYTDIAIEPFTDDEIETHELFATPEAKAYIEKKKIVDKASHASVVAGN